MSGDLKRGEYCMDFEEMRSTTTPVRELLRRSSGLGFLDSCIEYSLLFCTTPFFIFRLCSCFAPANVPQHFADSHALFLLIFRESKRRWTKFVSGCSLGWRLSWSFLLSFPRPLRIGYMQKSNQHLKSSPFTIFFVHHFPTTGPIRA